MNSCAIICEYNPMHIGHIYHIKNTKENLNIDILIAILSGNFTQRGSISILDRYAKCEACLKNGFDLVIELPPQFALSSAEYFAYGAISLINNLNIDYISFGSEEGEITPLNKIAKILHNEPSDFKINLRKYLDKGLPYHLCRIEALKEYGISNNIDLNHEILNSSNNILSIEYLKNILRIDSKIKPYTIKRIGASYNSCEINDEFPSATSIRNHLKGKNIKYIEDKLSKECFIMLSEFYKRYGYFIQDNLMFKYLRYKLLTLENKLMNLPDCTEGIHNKLLNSIKSSNSLEDFIKSSKSKRYTYTRLSRIACQYFIGFENHKIKSMLKERAKEAKILGFNDKGKYFLNMKKKEENTSLYSTLNKNEDSIEKLLNVNCTKAYSQINEDIDPFEDYLKHPIIF